LALFLGTAENLVSPRLFRCSSGNPLASRFADQGSPAPLSAIRDARGLSNPQECWGDLGHFRKPSVTFQAPPNWRATPYPELGVTPFQERRTLDQIQGAVEVGSVGVRSSESATGAKRSHEKLCYRAVFSTRPRLHGCLLQPSRQLPRRLPSGHT